MTIVECCEALYAHDPAAAEAAAVALAEMLTLHMTDTRTAMPALAFALTRPEERVRRMAAQAVDALADMGGHAELAFPAVFALRDDPDVELRRLVWRCCASIACLDVGRVRYVLPAILPAIERAAGDEDEETRRWAKTALERIASSPRASHVAGAPGER